MVRGLGDSWGFRVCGLPPPTWNFLPPPRIVRVPGHDVADHYQNGAPCFEAPYNLSYLTLTTSKDRTRPF